MSLDQDVDNAPDWARELFPEPEHWPLFIGMTLAVVKRRDPDACLGSSGDSIELTFEGTEMLMGTYNLARQCSMIEVAQWAATIEAWVIRITTSSLQIDVSMPETWDEVAPQLRPQLYNDSRLQAAPRSVLRKLADDLWLGVVIDRPDMMFGVMRDNLEDWGVSEDVLFARASANLDAADVPVQLNESQAPLVFGNADDEYGSVAMLERLPELLGDHEKGALVAFPLRTASFVLPLATKPSGDFVQRIVAASHTFFRKSGTQVTPNLFW